MVSDTESSDASVSPRSEDETLIDWLRDRDAFCPLCKYNVRNLTSPRCPECGQVLQLTVALADPYLKAWIALMTAVCAGAGMGVLWSYFLITQGWPRGGNLMGMKTAVIMQVLMVPATAFVLILRRRFQRLSRTAQWLLASAGIGLVLFSYFAIFSSAR